MTATDYDGPNSEGFARKAAIDAILAEWAAIREEKRTIRLEWSKLLAREREADAKMADCKAAARLFGISDHLLDDTEGAGRNLTTMAVRAWKKWFARNDADSRDIPVRAIASHPIAQVPEDAVDPEVLAADERITETVEQLIALSTAESPVRPATRDIVLGQLKGAGESGVRAAQIQSYIETNYAEKIHGKTVSMTLNRLQREGLARRDGHLWLYTPPASATETAIQVNGAHP